MKSDFLSRIKRQNHISRGACSGVNGTPTFFINGERHNGPFDYDTLRRAIKERIGAHRDRGIA